MQTISIQVQGQRTQDFNDEDILEEFIEQIRRRAAEPDSPRMFVAPLPDLFGFSVNNAEKCAVVMVDDLSPRDLPIESEYFCVDVQVQRNGSRATSLVLADGRVMLSGDIVPVMWSEDEGHRIVIVWLFENSNARLGEYFYHDDITCAFLPTRNLLTHSADRCGDRSRERPTLVFDRFRTLGNFED